MVRKVAEIFGTFAIGKLQQGASVAQMVRNLQNLVTGGVHMLGVGAGPFGAGGVPKALEAVHVIGLVVVIAAVLAAVVKLSSAYGERRTGCGPRERAARDQQTNEDWVLDDLLLSAS